MRGMYHAERVKIRVISTTNSDVIFLTLFFWIILKLLSSDTPYYKTTIFSGYRKTVKAMTFCQLPLILVLQLGCFREVNVSCLFGCFFFVPLENLFETQLSVKIFKGRVPLKRIVKTENSKIKILITVWSHCVFSMFTLLYEKKCLMLKIDNSFFQSGGIMLKLKFH